MAKLPKPDELTKTIDYSPPETDWMETPVQFKTDTFCWGAKGKNLKIVDSAVFWPLNTDPLFPLVGTFPFPSSDHRLVWIDVRVK